MEALTPTQQVLVVISGLLVGFILGLIGGGGSILAVPLLLYFVGYDHPHIVIGTTAVAVALIAYANLFTHWRAGTVRWKPAILFALPGVIGAAVGAQVGKVFPSAPLLFLFALLMIVIALLIWRSGGSSSVRPPPTGKSMLVWIFPVGFGVGLLSGFFGIGGGFPDCTRSDICHRYAVAERGRLFSLLRWDVWNDDRDHLCPCRACQLVDCG